MHIVHGELRKAPFIKHNCGQDNQTTMFVVELSEMIKDFRTGEKSYTNYNAALFSKTPAHIEHLQKTLIVGNWIVVNCEKLKIKKSDCGQYINLDMDNAKLEGSGYIDNQQQPQQGGYQQQPQQPAQQGGYQQQPQQPSQQPQGGYQQPVQQPNNPDQSHLYNQQPVHQQSTQQPQMQQPQQGNGADPHIPF